MNEWEDNTEILEGEVVESESVSLEQQQITPQPPVEVGRNDRTKKGVLTTPLSWQGVPTWVVYLLTILGVIYLLNPTAGFIEVLPDNLPFVGNLDEGAAMMLIWYGLIEFFEGRKG